MSYNVHVYEKLRPTGAIWVEALQEPNLIYAIREGEGVVRKCSVPERLKGAKAYDGGRATSFSWALELLFVKINYLHQDTGALWLLPHLDTKQQTVL